MWNTPLREELCSLALQSCCKSALTDSSCWESLPRATLGPEQGWELLGPAPALHRSCRTGQLWALLAPPQPLRHPRGPSFWGRAHWKKEMLGPAAVFSGDRTWCQTFRMPSWGLRIRSRQSVVSRMCLICSESWAESQCHCQGFRQKELPLSPQQPPLSDVRKKKKELWLWGLNFSSCSNSRFILQWECNSLCTATHCLL